MNVFDLFPDCHYEDVTHTEGDLSIRLKSSNKTANCPQCETLSSRRNGHYSRHPYDVPIGGKAVRLELRVQRFFCVNDECRHRTFAAQFSFVSHQAQRCQRLKDAHTNIAIELGGEAGARLAGELNMPVSAGTLLSGIRLMSLPEVETPRVLGIDDWALKKRERHGTILVDLEKHQVIDVLDGRDSETVATWLKDHGGIETISRDRSHDYAKAAKEAAPDAEQVADRWHLLQNTRQMLERWFRTIQQNLTTLKISADMAST